MLAPACSDGHKDGNVIFKLADAGGSTARDGWDDAGHDDGCVGQGSDEVLEERVEALKRRVCGLRGLGLVQALLPLIYET